MVIGLLKKYNPQMEEEAAKKLPFNIDSIKPRDWIDQVEKYKNIRKSSPSAQETLAKRIFPKIKENLPLLDNSKTPIDLIE
ncbi:MAG: hypothetical protein GF383_15445 [Candidatus Lokiarchaeota archaeon]|nr:hypothetical protein [Candidatus Lokiarchaeota archaeon]MBD3342938.1 hypothetical protein [Candidatus Lokiarchaeota archaeon]